MGLPKLVDPEVEARVEAALSNLGPCGTDPWGASLSTTKKVLGVMSILYKHYFRVETRGLENVPDGRVVVVGNHSSQLAYDGAIVASSFALECNPPRFLRAMIERFFITAPIVGVMMTRTGQLTGLPQHARQLLEHDYPVLVFPEGHRGGGKVWRDRYKVMGFGRGFMRLALETGAPILPFGFVGGEEMCASFSRMEPLARLFGTPYFPITPTILPIPLPTKVHITFGEPLHFKGTGHEPDEVIAPMVHKVEDAVGRLIREGLDRRRGIFF